MLHIVTIRTWERGLLYRKGELAEVLGAGRHWIWGLGVEVAVVSTRDTWLDRADLDLIQRSGLLDGEVEFVRVAEHERLIAWVNGSIGSIEGSGLYGVWTCFDDIALELVDTTDITVQHDRIHEVASAAEWMVKRLQVDAEHVGLIYVDGAFFGELQSGAHYLWDVGRTVRHLSVDLRQQTLDITGQELMTRDRVTLRLNAVVTWQVVDAQIVASLTSDGSQALYREAQLALRAAVGTRTLDRLLEDKESLGDEVAASLTAKAEAFGLRLHGFGVRDVILNGEMKALLNRVTEARKEAEAAVITRREETAQMRSQANTARLLEGNATLMRLRELEVLERIATAGNLQVVLGEKGLAERIMNLL